MATDPAKGVRNECTHLAGCSDCNMIGASPSINDGDPVLKSIYLKPSKKKTHYAYSDKNSIKVDTD